MTIVEVKRQGHRMQRTASLGASITLASGAGEYVALFECATRCAEVLGDAWLKDLGDGIFEVIPCYKIPTSELHPALQKLTRKYSVALVEYAYDKTGGRFFPLWRIERTTNNTISTNPDDY